jgi:hypothetical protein
VTRLKTAARRTTTDPSPDVLRWVGGRLRWERYLAMVEARAATEAGPEADSTARAA